MVEGHEGCDGDDGDDGVLMMCWDTTTVDKWLCLLTISAPIVNYCSERSRSSRRVDEIDGEHAEGLPSVEAMASMVSMVCRYQGALTWKSPGDWWRRVASSGDEWRRMVASMGDWGADTEGADVEVPLCPQR